MDLTNLFSAGIFVQLALLCYVLGLLTRRELLLRSLILTGSMFYILYYYFISDTPLWDAIWASAIIGFANIWMIGVILLERTTLGMSPKMVELYRSFPTLYPGQFRKLIKTADWITAGEDTQISKAGTHLDSLFLVASGNMILLKDGANALIGPGHFVGEISYLIDGPASADVIAPKGIEYIRWDRSILAKQTKRSPAISNALVALFNRDIAVKLAVSRPSLTKNTVQN
ncbi:cyclic nucleotide-binding domain-containing protein [Octadecabacter sp. 1_MG-2023]|uniref:cyclic nucleotide-binding domain-containing protein n=2 Tax=unclassified Octadecabacter TaxID=196158 RepID=UPI001C08E0B2|nr:cyclic nucleotide-binding domain-containing protein [Octadecabacter sp. 1_MG-2023]MBU2994423.1 cyclic nucleotide-binding domain-containing protein [Octadecabacter sp. B2R22]